jgi:hypothetical protein
MNYRIPCGIGRCVLCGVSNTIVMERLALQQNIISSFFLYQLPLSKLDSIDAVDISKLLRRKC